MIRVRKAALSDYQDIWQVHASDIPQWVESSGEVDLAAFAQTTMAERWQLGGQWMSPETCAIHLNALLLAGQTPLVASLGRRLLGEAELFLGEDSAFGGPVLNISVLYVHCSARGKGLGSALLTETLRRARVYGCKAVTVYHPSPGAEQLYRRFGLTEELEQVVLTLPVSVASGQPDRQLQPTEWPKDYSALSDLAHWVGSYQSSVQCWQQLAWAQSPGLYALPLLPITDRMVFTLAGPNNRAYLCLRPLGEGRQAELHIWSAHPDLELVAWAMPLARQVGIRQLQLVVTKELASELLRQYGGESKPGHKRLTLRLP